MSLDLSDFENRPAKAGYGSNVNKYDENRNYPDRFYKVDRPFIAWDGEGITYDNSPQQAYVLLAASTGEFIRKAEGLSTWDCLGLLFRVEEENRNAIHIGFSFGYDTNQILNSFTRRELSKFNDRTNIGKTYYWRENIRFKYYPGKSLQVTRGKYGEPNFVNVRIYDTFHFFQKSFLKVVADYAPERVKEIEGGKQNRSRFHYRDIDEITRYCLAENQILVRVLDKVRQHLQDNGLFLRDWYGPGAIANTSMRVHKIKRHLGSSSREIEDVSRYAYQGGRFELFRAGYYEGDVWQYDINSAYPSAIAYLPSFKEGYWEPVTSFEKGVFGIWNISYSDRRTGRQNPFNHFRARPLFFRNSRGGIGYPPRTEGWYWQPEAELYETAAEGENFEIIQGYIWRPKSEVKPFEWVIDRYNQRREMKRIGDGGERAIKLELNSLYGKMAQRTGWFRPGDKIPTFHNLSWAGYVTSFTRSKLYRAYLQQPEAIISFETDAVFSLFPLILPISEQLGDWSEQHYNNILYIQSGFYYLNGNRATKESDIAHFRGFDKNDSLSFDRMMDWLDRLNPMEFIQKDKVKGTTTRFVGYKRALKQKTPWRTWVTEEKELLFAGHAKRVHFPIECAPCRKGQKFTDNLHFLELGTNIYTEKVDEHLNYHSAPHNIPWLEKEANIWLEEKEMESTDGFSK